MHKNLITALLLLFSWVSPCAAQAEPPTAEPDPDNPPKEPIDPIAYAIKQVNEQDNGVTIDVEKTHLDIQATVCMRHGDFLEMFACTKDTREHESLLVIDAMPSTVHLGLLLLGQEPGKPLSYDMKSDPPKLVPATGPQVGVYIVIKVDGIEREVPANRWVQDNKTEEMMQGNTWLFAGSQFADLQGKQVYHADLNGSAISLVNFGDDLLALPNRLTDANESHDKIWAPRSRVIPKVGTKVAIRLKPKAEDKTEDAEDRGKAENPPPQPAPEDKPAQDTPQP